MRTNNQCSSYDMLLSLIMERVKKQQANGDKPQHLDVMAKQRLIHISLVSMDLKYRKVECLRTCPKTQASSTQSKGTASAASLILERSTNGDGARRHLAKKRQMGQVWYLDTWPHRCYFGGLNLSQSWLFDDMSDNMSNIRTTKSK